jgi:quinol monooxygenase YgiN
MMRRTTMYVRVTRGRVDPAKWDELPGITPGIAAAIRALPGYRSYVGGGDRGTGTTITVTTWATEEHARFSRNELLADLVARLHALGVQMDPPEIYQLFAE